LVSWDIDGRRTQNFLAFEQQHAIPFRGVQRRNSSNWAVRARIRPAVLWDRDGAKSENRAIQLALKYSLTIDFTDLCLS